MTHYMELLSLNQPYNLILFMVIPVGLTEAFSGDGVSHYVSHG